MKKINLFICFVFSATLFLSTTAFILTGPYMGHCSEYVKTWAKTYGGSGYEVIPKIRATSDGGYIAACGTMSFGAGNYDSLVLKIDNNGDIEWQKTYGGKNFDFPDNIQVTNDGGYIMVVSTTSFGSGSYDVWILKLNSNGGIEWQKTYGGNGVDRGREIHETSDGGYIMAGLTKSFGAGDSDAWILKLDNSGSVEWQKTYGGSNSDAVYRFKQTNDNGYIIAGSTYLQTDFRNGWVIKLDSSGNIEWQKIYRASSTDYLSIINQTSDGGYIVGGLTESFDAGDETAWILKLDSSGSVEWQKIYGGSDLDQLLSIQETNDGGYIAAGYLNGVESSPGFVNTDSWIIKLDSNGNTEWQKNYGEGSSISSRFFGLRLANDGGYIAAGYAFFTEAEWDIWIVKVDSKGDIAGCDIVTDGDAVAITPTIEVSNSNAIETLSQAIITDTDCTPQDSSAAPVTICAGEIEVEIDIKPGVYPNCFNNNEHGVIPVVILGKSNFNVHDIDPSTIELESLLVKVVGKNDNALAHYEDINGDNIDDLVVQIEDTDSVFEEGIAKQHLQAFFTMGLPLQEPIVSV